MAMSTIWKYDLLSNNWRQNQGPFFFFFPEKKNQGTEIMVNQGIRAINYFVWNSKSKYPY